MATDADDSCKRKTDPRSVWTSWLWFSPDALPLRVHASFVEEHSREAVDPIEAILEQVKSGRSGTIEAEVWLHLRPTPPRVRNRVAKYAAYIDGQFPHSALHRRFLRSVSSSCIYDRFATWATTRCARPSDRLRPAIAERLSQHLLHVSIELQVRTPSGAKDIGMKRLADLRSAFMQFLSGEHTAFRTTPRKKRRRLSWSRAVTLTPAEVATLWHPPVSQVKAPRIERAAFRELEPPKHLSSKEKHQGIVTLGRVKFRSERQQFGIDIDSRRRHLYLIGKTGMGKTTLLQNMLHDDIVAGRGVAVIDPHGDLANTTLDLIPKHRTNDVVVFDPADTTFPIAFNPLQVPSGGDSTLVADGVLSAFARVFAFDESQAPRMMHIFRNALLTLVETPEATLLSVQRILVDAAYRKSAIARVRNPVVRDFWLDEFGKWDNRFRTEAIASLQNKLGAFLTNEKLQRILGQPKSRVDLRRIMDEGKVLVVNLSKGAIGENASNLLGALLVSSLQLAAMSRANIPESERRDYSIIIDEFQNYATSSIATFLSEARKYRTHLVLSHQYTQQLDEDILAAVLGNVGSMIVFQVGADDAERFERQLGGGITIEDLANTPKYHAYCRLLIDGMPSRPFSMTTIAPSAITPLRAAIVRKVSQQHYSRHSAEVRCLVGGVEIGACRKVSL